jgi:hypothetical protein
VRGSIADSLSPCEDQENLTRPVGANLAGSTSTRPGAAKTVKELGPGLLRETRFSQVKRFPSHTAAVNEVSFDLAGEYVASCSDDGTVVVNGLYTDERERYAYHRPIKVRIELSVCADGKMKNCFWLGSS